jgi:hypothetical protein
MQVNGTDVLANSVVGIAATESIARPHALQTKLSFKLPGPGNPAAVFTSEKIS